MQTTTSPVTHTSVNKTEPYHSYFPVNLTYIHKNYFQRILADYCIGLLVQQSKFSDTKNEVPGLRKPKIRLKIVQPMYQVHFDCLTILKVF